jgi:hypothetical protein
MPAGVTPFDVDDDSGPNICDVVPGGIVEEPTLGGGGGVIVPAEALAAGATNRRAAATAAIGIPKAIFFIFESRLSKLVLPRHLPGNQ